MRGDNNSRGLIPRTVKEIFHKISSDDLIANIKISYFEIHNENIRDLLDEKDRALEIREDARKNITIVGLTETDVKSEDDAIKLYETGEARRKFAITELNPNSSRSHTIFRVELTVVSKKTYQRMISNINMVDLAGSEGVSRTKAEGALKK